MPIKDFTCFSSFSSILNIAQRLLMYKTYEGNKKLKEANNEIIRSSWTIHIFNLLYNADLNKNVHHEHLKDHKFKLHVHISRAFKNNKIMTSFITTQQSYLSIDWQKRQTNGVCLQKKNQLKLILQIKHLSLLIINAGKFNLRKTSVPYDHSWSIFDKYCAAFFNGTLNFNSYHISWISFNTTYLILSLILF